MFSIRLTVTPIFLALAQLFLGNLHSKSIQPTRKFNTAAFFHGLANTCAQAGNTISAQTAQEKQQAACNMLSSAMQTAATLSEKTHKRSISLDDDLANINKFTINFLNAMSPEEKAQLLPANCIHLRAITELQNEDVQTQFISLTLASEKDGPALMGELLSVFKAIIVDQINELFDTLEPTNATH